MTLNDFKSYAGDKLLGLALAAGHARARRRARDRVHLHRRLPGLAIAYVVLNRMFLAAAVMAVLFLIQLPMQRKLATDPAGLAPWYCASAIPPFVWGMLVAALAIRFGRILIDESHRRWREHRRQRRGRRPRRERAEVILLERDLKRKKPCGGAIPPKAISEFGVPSEIIERKVKRAVVIGPSESRVEMDVRGTRPRAEDYIIMVTREVLDQTMRAKATAAGADLREASFVSHEETADGVNASCAIAAAAKRRSHADYLIGADGAGSAVATLVRTARVHATPRRSKSVCFSPTKRWNTTRTAPSSIWATTSRRTSTAGSSPRAITSRSARVVVPNTPTVLTPSSRASRRAPAANCAAPAASCSKATRCPCSATRSSSTDARCSWATRPAWWPIPRAKASTSRWPRAAWPRRRLMAHVGDPRMALARYEKALAAQVRRDVRLPRSAREVVVHEQ